MTAPAAVRERPILFSGPMVRAILGGTKTQTRRVVMPQPTGEPRPLEGWSRRLAATCGDHSPDPARSASHVAHLRGRLFPFGESGGSLRSPVCPFGQPGDQLWVRETHALEDDGSRVVYAADREARHFNCTRDQIGEPFYLASVYEPDGWRPSIHMPRWASRLSLELTGVRVERLWEISESDVRAEGCEWLAYCCAEEMEPNDPTEYSDLWDMLNAKRGYPWAANPWVWVLEFRMVAP